MLLRMFAFQVPKKEERRMVGFMRRAALPMVKHIPGCRAAYFLRLQHRRGEYMWVTVWASEAARARAMRRPEWQALVRQEEERFFAGRPEIRHYQVLLKK